MRPDWNPTAERRPSVNNRSIVQAMGKAIGGGTSTNGMVWARGHKNDFDHWAKEAGDDAWNCRHVLDIYRRIEDWHGVPDPQWRGSGGDVFVQPAPDPSSIAPAFLGAAKSLGVPTFADQNGVMQEGSGGAVITNVRIRDGRRLSLQRTGSDWAELGGWARETKTCPTPSCAAPDRHGDESGS